MAVQANQAKYRIRITVVAADDLVKRSVFRLPDPFATVSIDSELSHTTSVIERSVSPCWNENFDVLVNESSVVAVRVLDKRRLNKPDQGFLGMVDVRVSDVINLQNGGHNVLTLPLKRSDENLVVQGKLLVSFSTNTNTSINPPITNAGPSQLQYAFDALNIPSSSSSSSSSSTPRPSSNAIAGPSRSQLRRTFDLLEEGPSSHSTPTAVPLIITDRIAGPSSDAGGSSTTSNSLGRPSSTTTLTPAPSISGRSESSTTTLSQRADQPALPAGWEERFTPDGSRPYYVDHNTRRTTWVDPRHQQYAASTSSLARSSTSTSAAAAIPHSPWVDPRQQQQQQPASTSYATTSSPPWVDPRQQQQQYASTSSLARNSTSTSAAVAVPSLPGPSSSSAGSSSQQQPLPEGWEQRFTPQGRAYYVNHATRSTTWTDPRLPVPTRQTPAPTSSVLGPLPSGWEMRVTNTNRIYFVDHNTHTTSWDDPRLPSNLDPDKNVPQYKKDFRRKLVYFRTQPQMRVKHAREGKCEIRVRRGNLFEDAFEAIMKYPDGEELKKSLMISFRGEEGLDYGGVAREFFFLLSHDVFNPLYGLFEYSSPETYTLQINPLSGLFNPDQHLSYFRFLGRCLGLSIFHNRFLDVYFVRTFYKLILGQKIKFEDVMEDEVGLKWMLDNDIEGVIEETFTLTEEKFGEMIEVELKEGGKEIAVTDENKREYVDLVTEWRAEKRVKEQMDSFLLGFHELIPKELIRVFDERELELLIGGMSSIDIDDWIKFTDYRGYDPTSDLVIQWFWQIVRSWPVERQSKLLQFVTGTSRVPVNGFRDLQGSDGPRRFTIERGGGGGEELPKSHTCFNRIDLPPYEDYETLEQKLTLAVEETMGFGQE